MGDSPTTIWILSFVSLSDVQTFGIECASKRSHEGIVNWTLAEKKPNSDHVVPCSRDVAMTTQFPENEWIDNVSESSLFEGCDPGKPVLLGFRTAYGSPMEQVCREFVDKQLSPSKVDAPTNC